jgi:glucose-1-phosphate thymidylyltransferase
MRLAYLPLEESPSVPFTLDHAYPFVRHARVAFGFPDILLNPPEAFVKMLDQQEQSSADVTLGVCRTTPKLQYDLVDFDERGVVRDVILKPHNDPFRYSWALALWTPVFTEFLHGYTNQNRSSTYELSAGHVLRAAVQAGLRLEAIVLSEETYLDIGTPDGLAEALRRGLQHVL